MKHTRISRLLLAAIAAFATATTALADLLVGDLNHLQNRVEIGVKAPLAFTRQSFGSSVVSGGVLWVNNLDQLKFTTSAGTVSIGSGGSSTGTTNDILAGDGSGGFVDVTIGSGLSWNSGTHTLSVGDLSATYQPLNAKLTAFGALANGLGWLHNNGAGTFTYTTPTKADVGLGSVEDVALSGWTGSANLVTLGTGVITGLAEDATPSASNDFVMTYDASGDALKKVKLTNLPGSGGGDVTAAGDNTFTGTQTWATPGGQTHVINQTDAMEGANNLSFQIEGTTHARIDTDGSAQFSTNGTGSGVYIGRGGLTVQSGGVSVGTGTGIAGDASSSTIGGFFLIDPSNWHVGIQSGHATTGFLEVQGKTSGGLRLSAGDATSRIITITTANQTTGNAAATIPDLAGTGRNFVMDTTTQTLTNKTISGSTNTLSNIANSSLTNSAITIAGTSTSLGGSISLDTITGLGSNGLVKRTAANTYAIATAGTDYLVTPRKSIATFTPLVSQPPASNYAPPGTVNSIATLDFADGSTTGAVFLVQVPNDAVLTSGLATDISWRAATATTGNVVWQVSFERMNTNSNSDSFDTAQTATGSANATNGIPTVTAITNTAIDSCTAGDFIRIKVERVGADGSDTMTDTAQLLGVSLRTAN